MAIHSAMVGNPMMQQGVAVGAGEIPNGAGPFVNGGLHNTSDDSIMMGGSASNRVNLRPEADMESLASRVQPQPQQLAPLGRPQGKLTPGRMSGRGAPSPGPQSAGPRAPAAAGQGGGQPVGGQQRPAAPQQARQSQRPESRAG